MGDGGSSEEPLSLEESELLSSEEDSELLGFEEAGDLGILCVRGDEDSVLRSSGCSCLVGSHSALGRDSDNAALSRAAGRGELEILACGSGDADRLLSSFTCKTQLELFCKSQMAAAAGEVTGLPSLLGEEAASL